MRKKALIDDPTVQVKVDGMFNAAALDALIQRLAQTRSVLEPPVELEPPSELDDVLVQREAVFKVRTLFSGGLRIWLRSEGLGWAAFDISEHDTDVLRAFLVRRPGEIRTAH